MNWSQSKPLVYPVSWRHPAGCAKRQTGSLCPAPPKPPLPTKAQLDYQEAEIVAIVCFQMDTYAGTDGDPGCNPSNWNTGVRTSQPATFAPHQLNVSQWVEVSKAMGAKMSWLTAKHGCGFLLWPTKTTLPDGRPYGYDVGASTAGTHVDIVKQWMDLNRAAGIGPGLYYSLKDNFYLNSAAGGLVRKGPLLPGQENVTQAEFEAIELAQLTELWSEYGTLAETWFDGGWAPDMLPALKLLISKYLPNTAAFGGVGVTPNAVKWVGTEVRPTNAPTRRPQSALPTLTDPSVLPASKFDRSLSHSKVQRGVQAIQIKAIQVRVLSISTCSNFVRHYA
jgi:alpha-L-fucosidase